MNQEIRPNAVYTTSETEALLKISKRTSPRDTGNDDRSALGKVRRVGLIGHRAQGLDIGRRTNERGELRCRDAIFQEILVGRRTKLAHVVRYRFVLGRHEDLLERGNRHGGQQTDDDDHDHDFDEGEALLGGCVHVLWDLGYLWIMNDIRAAREQR